MDRSALSDFRWPACRTVAYFSGMIPRCIRHGAFCLVLLFTSAWPTNARAQAADHKGLYLGVGFGQDLGGLLGFGLTYWPAPWLSAFVGGGWAIADFSYQTGLEFNLPSGKRVSPFLTAMYGYNGAIHVEGLEKLDGVYTGPTLGGGVILKQRTRRNYWRFSINVPIRSQEFLDDWEEVKRRPDVELRSDLLPVTIGVGFHLGL